MVRLAVGVHMVGGEVLYASEWIKDRQRPCGTAIQFIDLDRLSTPMNAGKTTGLTEGAKLERERISMIIGSDEGKKRPTAALSTALKTAMSTEEATSFLADLAEEKAPAQPAASTNANGFVDHMNASEHPNVGKEGENNGGGGDDLSASLSLARGFGLPGMRSE